MNHESCFKTVGAKLFHDFKKLDLGSNPNCFFPDPTVQPHIHVTTAPVRHSSDSTKDDNEVGEICDGYTTYDPTSGPALALSR